MRVYFKGNDDSQTAMELLVDWFEITDTVTTSGLSLEGNEIELNYYPNPFKQQINIEYQTNQQTKALGYRVFNSLGQSIENGWCADNAGILSLGQGWDSGIYIVEIGQKRIKVIKR